MSGNIINVGSGAGAIFSVGVVGASVSNTHTFATPDAAILAGKNALLGRVLVPAGKKIVVRSAGVTPESGVAITGVKAQAYDVDGAEEICSTATASAEFATGNEAAAGTLVTLRIVNGSASTVVASGFVTLSIVDA